MELITLNKAVQKMIDQKIHLSEKDMDFVVRFAFHTGDYELTEKLIDELAKPEVATEYIRAKYETLLGNRTNWIRTIEDVLVALEVYRIQEEKAVKRLSKLISVNGINLTEDEIKEMSPDKIKEYVVKKDQSNIIGRY